MIRPSAALATVAAMAAGITGLPAQTTQPTALRTQSLGVADNLYLVSGGGGNSLLMTGDTDVVLIDAKAAGQGRNLAGIASGISDQKVTTVVLTHAHADHAGGVADLAGPLQIVAHDNTKTILARSGVTTTITSFADTLSLGEGLDRIDLYYFGAGHTGGDIVVVFPGKRVAYLGDLFPGKMAPVIDAANGGSGVALPQTLMRAVAALKGITRIIPGHAVPPPGSPLGRWVTIADLQEYAGFTRDFLAAVQDAFKAGKTAEEAATSLQLPPQYSAYNLDDARSSVRAIYGELGKR